MLTVWCVWWRDPAAPDKYDAYCVQRLQRTVRENLSIPHRFVCITNERVEGVATMPPPVDWPGWWGKIGLFKPGVCTPMNLYLDLDVVVTGSLDDLIKEYGDAPLAMPWNWAQSGHGGCQSSVMVFKQCRANLPIYHQFNPDNAHWPPVNKPGTLWGDQEWITTLRNAQEIEVFRINEHWVKSYKYHCRNGLPQDCRVVVFHGEPKPQNVSETWFKW